MLSGLSFRSAFIFSINPLILPAFPLTSFHLAEANLVPKANLVLEILKTSFSPSSDSQKMRWSQG